MNVKACFTNKMIALVIFLIYSGELIAQNPDDHDFNCFSILAGKNATADGSVMFAHNEDDYGDQLVNWYKVPSMKHPDGEMIEMKNGGQLPQIKQTWSYLWLEMPGMEFSDSYMNEWGVTIGSDQCLSREENPDLTLGGIGYELREAMASGAKSSREAVKIGGTLIEQYGYASSGRTYCIADANEAWMLSVVYGKHWVAQRIPDNEVAIIPNYYTISTVNLADTLNYYGSHDLFTYAEKNQWYDPDKEVFNFRMAYGDPENIKHPGNIVRHWSSINLLSEKKCQIDDEFPFSFVPEKKITLRMLFTVLRNHNEGSVYDESDGYKKGNPHGYVRAICSPATQYGFVAQLRSNLPGEIAFVLWLAPFRPCVQPFIPWYIGITEIPQGFAAGDYKTARRNQFLEIENISEFAQGHKFPEFVSFAKKVDENYAKEIEGIQQKIQTLENELLQSQAEFENRVLSVFSSEPQQTRKILTEYTEKLIEQPMEIEQR